MLCWMRTKKNAGTDMMIDGPAELDDEQLDELALKVEQKA